jgi:hypothetical protein
VPVGATRPAHTVYLVDSPQASAAIHAEYAAMWSMQMETGSAPLNTFTILDISTAEGLRSAEHINGLLLEADSWLDPLTVVDLTGP